MHSFEEFAETTALLEHGVRQAEQTAERLGWLGEQLDELTVSGTSGDGRVRATVNSSGALVDLDIADEMSGRRGREIAEAVLSCVRTARARLATRAGEITGEALGEESPLARRLTDHMRSRLSDEPDPADPVDASPRRADATTDEDYSAQSIMVGVRPRDARGTYRR